MKHQLLVLTAGLLAVAALATGCPGKLDSGAFESTIPCDPKGLLKRQCAGAACHDPTDISPLRLDLISPGVEARLVNRDATYYGVDGADAGLLPPCTQQREKLIDGAQPDESLFIKKLEGKQACGSEMPYSKTLLPSVRDQLKACLEGWARDLARHANPDAGRDASSGGDASSRGGTGSGGAGAGGTSRGGSGGGAP